MPWPPAIGDLLPLAEHACGIRRKLLTYSLAHEHERGGDKARAFLLALSIERAHVDHLEAELRAGVRVTPISRVDVKRHGFLFQVRIPVRGVMLHRNRVLPVTTGWHVPEEGMAPRLASAYLKS
ncbi:DUF6883 domain-containing protein [Conexibacter woesei]|uniref:DUF6883 domain-containing protein n=1 Tax=Conexibacter woesei (strain DSM 14684 / CCUG 47730 / CIP 108061 / JCM 11494 / NBRC 100937 / ID131577) TaxID=469383 RepID=D3F621_CONWI|nr:DUF6883 domain-containing protein [Conexibacter woesei]ADB48694.1 conserved hypothetical protein [Conexibacter woesei DSM 14684]